ncbi:MAG: hypothetical protein WKF96_06690 [Solirubrobacteraceae bacterium]
MQRRELGRVAVAYRRTGRDDDGPAPFRRRCVLAVDTRTGDYEVIQAPGLLDFDSYID